MIAVDQYGQRYYIGDNPPRKWLLNHLGRQHADKMYVDGADGKQKQKHIGYVIAGFWFRLYYEWVGK